MDCLGRSVTRKHWTFFDLQKKSGHSPSISFEFDSDSDNEDGKYIGENIKIDNNFGTAIKYVNSDNFCMADVDNSFGSLTVYFDNAIIQSGSAKIKVDNSFGETNLYIPKEWKTENNLGQAFGSVKHMAYVREAATIL